MTAILDRIEGLVLEAAALIGDAPLDTTRAEQFEGPTVSVLVSPRAAGENRSDISIVMVPKGAPDPLDSVVVALRGDGSCYEARLDVRGRCVIRDVPDARYWLRFGRSGADRA